MADEVLTRQSGGMADESALAPGGRSILSAIKASGVQVAVTVPDIWTSEGLLRLIAADADLRHIRVCKEEEGFGICAGLAFADKRAVLVMQSTGLLATINGLRVVGVEFCQPVCMIVGLLQKEPGVLPINSDKYGVRIVEPILDAMGVAHTLIETEADVAKIGPAIESAYARSQPVALLIGRSPVQR